MLDSTASRILIAASRVFSRSRLRRASCVLAACALGTTGCTSGEHDQSYTFRIEPTSPGSDTFGGWTDIRLGIDVSSVGPTVIYGVTLGLQEPAPAGVTDLTFLSSIVGKEDVSQTPVVHCDSFPKGQTTVDFVVDDTGDIRPLFQNGNFIRIDWTGTLNPDFQGLPSTGVEIGGDIVINVD